MSYCRILASKELSLNNIDPVWNSVMDTKKKFKNKHKDFVLPPNSCVWDFWQSDQNPICLTQLILTDEWRWANLKKFALFKVWTKVCHSNYLTRAASQKIKVWFETEMNLFPEYLIHWFFFQNACYQSTSTTVYCIDMLHVYTYENKVRQKLVQFHIKGHNAKINKCN